MPGPSGQHAHILYEEGATKKVTGYILAAIGPFVVGLIHAATGTWTAVLIMMACSGAVMTAAGLRVAGRVMVDDELTVS